MPKSNTIEFEKEFEKIAPADLEIDGWVVNLRPAIFPLKDFISQKLQEQRAKDIKEMREILEKEYSQCEDCWVETKDSTKINLKGYLIMFYKDVIKALKQ